MSSKETANPILPVEQERSNKDKEPNNSNPDIPIDLTNSFSPESKKTIAEMEPASKNFLWKLYKKFAPEKYDRVTLAKTKAIADRSAGNVEAHMDKRDSSIKAAKQHQFDKDAFSAKIDATLKALEEQGAPIGQETLDIKKQKMAEYDSRAAKEKKEAAIAWDKIQQEKQTLADYRYFAEAKIMEVKEKFNSKIDTNNATISRYDNETMKLDVQIGSRKEALTKLDLNVKDIKAGIAELRQSLGANYSDPKLEQHLLALESNQKKMEQAISALAKKKTGITGEVNKLQTQNGQWGVKRDKILGIQPVSAEKKNAEQPGVKSYTARGDTLSITLGDENRVVISKNGHIGLTGGGAGSGLELTAFDALTDDQLSTLSDIPGEVLGKYLPPEKLAKIKKDVKATAPITGEKIQPTTKAKLTREQPVTRSEQENPQPSPTQEKKLHSTNAIDIIQNFNEWYAKKYSKDKSLATIDQQEFNNLAGKDWGAIARDQLLEYIAKCNHTNRTDLFKKRPHLLSKIDKFFFERKNDLIK